jgi:hypothetical protein
MQLTFPHTLYIVIYVSHAIYAAYVSMTRSFQSRWMDFTHHDNLKRGKRSYKSCFMEMCRRWQQWPSYLYFINRRTDDMNHSCIHCQVKFELKEAMLTAKWLKCIKAWKIFKFRMCFNALRNKLLLHVGCHIQNVFKNRLCPHAS